MLNRSGLALFDSSCVCFIIVYLQLIVFESPEYLINTPISLIPGNICFVSLYLQFILVDTFVHVVVLAAPAPVLVGEPIDQSVLRWSHR